MPGSNGEEPTTADGRAAARLRPGDVLLQELAGAVADVTSNGGAPFSHCAILTAGGPRAAVTEAWFPRVRTVALEEFLARSTDLEGHPAVTAYRPRPPLDRLGRAAAGAALELVGRAYDVAYAPGAEALYCSELIVCAYRRANAGDDVFVEAPITFRDPGSEEPNPQWAAHFRRLGLDIPEGVLGSNPAMLAASAALVVVHRFGGWPVPLAPAATVAHHAGCNDEGTPA